MWGNILKGYTLYKGGGGVGRGKSVQIYPQKPQTVLLGYGICFAIPQDIWSKRATYQLTLAVTVLAVKQTQGKAGHKCIQA